MAQRYGLLPSEVIVRATTFDMVMMDISLSVEKYWREKDQPGYIPPVSEEELLKIKERADANNSY
jgi:hypothetical protein